MNEIKNAKADSYKDIAHDVGWLVRQLELSERIDALIATAEDQENTVGQSFSELIKASVKTTFNGPASRPAISEAIQSHVRSLIESLKTSVPHLTLFVLEMQLDVWQQIFLAEFDRLMEAELNFVDKKILEPSITFGKTGCILQYDPQALYWLIASGCNHRSADALVGRFPERAFSECKPMNGVSILMHSILAGTSDYTRAILNIGCDMNYRGRNGVTALMLAAMIEVKGTFESILEESADLEAIDEDGNTVLHYAVSGQNHAIIEYLMRSGFDLSRKNKAGETALMVAMKSGAEDTMRLLMKKFRNKAEAKATEAVNQ